MKKKIAMVMGMESPVPPIDPSFSVSAASTNSAIFLAASEGYDVTVYALETSTIVNYAKDIAVSRRWKYNLDEQKKSISFIDELGHTNSRLSLRSLNSVESIWGHDDPKYISDTENALFQKVLDDDKKENFDIISSNFNFEHTVPTLLFNLSEVQKGKHVFTVHGSQLDSRFSKHGIQLIALSNAHADILKNQGGNVIGVAPHGIDAEYHQMSSESAGYAAFIGRMHDTKGADLAIAAAKIANKPLIIASALHEYEMDYFNAEIQPHITITDEDFFDKYSTPDDLKEAIEATIGDPPIIFIGAVSGENKRLFFQNAECLLNPIKWPEPFGLVRIEGAAFGTPVISIQEYGDIKCGAVGEQIEGTNAGVGLIISQSNIERDTWSSAVLALAEAITNLDERIAEQSEAKVRKSVRQVFDACGTLPQNAKALSECYDKVGVSNNLQYLNLNSAADRT